MCPTDDEPPQEAPEANQAAEDSEIDRLLKELSHVDPASTKPPTPASGVRPSPEIECKAAGTDQPCIFPACGCSKIAEGFKPYAGPSPDDRPQPFTDPSEAEPFPQCPTISRAEHAAAMALINELAPGTRRDSYWLTVGPYETIVRHMRLACESTLGFWPTPTPPADVLHTIDPYQPGAVAAIEKAINEGRTVSINPDDGMVTMVDPTGALDVTKGPTMTDRPFAPPCHPFSSWASKGDGTTVCMWCGAPAPVS